jgi:hypothetical protein
VNIDTEAGAREWAASWAIAIKRTPMNLKRLALAIKDLRLCLRHDVMTKQHQCAAETLRAIEFLETLLESK